MSFARFLSKYRNRLSRILGVTSCALSLVGVAVVGSNSFPSTVALADSSLAGEHQVSGLGTGDGYVTMDNSVPTLHLRGENYFTFDNLKPMFNAHTMAFLIPEYCMSVKCRDVVYSGVALNVVCTLVTEMGIEVPSIYVDIQSLNSNGTTSTKRIMQSTTIRHDPTDNNQDLWDFDWAYLDGFDGRVDILWDAAFSLDSPTVTLDSFKIFAEVMTDFEVGEFANADGTITADYVYYECFAFGDFLDWYTENGMKWHLLQYDVEDVENYTIVADLVNMDFSPSTLTCLIPFSCEFRKVNGVMALDTLQLIALNTSFQGLVNDGFPYLYGLPFAYSFDPTEREFSFYGSLDFLGRFQRNSTNYAPSDYLDMVMYDFDGYRYVYFDLPTPTNPDPTYTCYIYLDWVGIERYFYGPVINGVYKSYLLGFSDGQNDVLNAMYAGDTNYQAGYKAGKKAGYAEGLVDGSKGKASTIMNLFGAVVSVPIDVLNGLSPMVIYDTPLISIIITLLFVGVFLFMVKRFIR